MWRSVLLGVVLAGVLAGCSGGGSKGATQLRLTVYNGDGHPRQHYSVVCDGPGAKPASLDAKLCPAREDYLPRQMAAHHSCICGIYVHRVMVTGTLDGERIRSPVEVSGCDACGLGKRAGIDVRTVFDVLRIPGGL
jgi:hypothetical protein